ncbi:hypothetical protein [Methylobacterium sp. E-066]|uniref:hypothetical protein n=1 Tax=Methylobacterium sp. E-066 TaxID=2836584 RepID=UPI001FB8F2D5|nr:hypothetical protein [Methylobacterium sp. E-066]MCJ2141379.1 hypothetical protein [Methylobacterium sp. E-066]
MSIQKDDLSDVFVTGGGNLEQIVYHTQYDDPDTGPHGFAVAVVRPYGEGHRRRIAMRWCDQPGRKLGFPQSSARAAWFEVPLWLESAILKAVAEQLAKEISEEG